MTSEEAIKELKDASDSEVRYGDTEHHYNEVMKRVEAFEMAIKALEQARWIPVSERLPQDGQKVLVTTRSINLLEIDTCIFHHASAFWKHYVIAWMPLPEPYRESEE